MKKTKYQRRSLGAGPMELRQVQEGDGPTRIVGYAVVFNSEAYGEVVRQGAFTKTLQEQKDIKAFWNHDTNLILGRTSNGTLNVKEDSKGLWVEIEPNPGTTYGRDALAAVERGDVKGMSFGFRITKRAETERQDGTWLLEILEVDLREVSPCAEPWYEETTAETRENCGLRIGDCGLEEGDTEDRTEPGREPHSETIEAGQRGVDESVEADWDTRNREIELLALEI
jgi:HK97 family phage prohead protease